MSVLQSHQEIMQKKKEGKKIYTNRGLFSISVALLQLVSFIAVTNRFICQSMGKDSTSSKKYVA